MPMMDRSRPGGDKQGRPEQSPYRLVPPTAPWRSGACQIPYAQVLSPLAHPARATAQREPGYRHWQEYPNLLQQLRRAVEVNWDILASGGSPALAVQWREQG